MFKKILLVALLGFVVLTALPQDGWAEDMTFTVIITDNTAPDNGPVDDLDIHLVCYLWNGNVAFDIPMPQVDAGEYSVIVFVWTTWGYWRVVDVWNEVQGIAPGEPVPLRNIWPNPPGPVPLQWTVEDLRQ
jgi:hypothetical protein